MDFDDAARLDTSQVQDARGSRMGGRGLAIGGGGGLLGIVVLVLTLLLNGGGDGTSALTGPETVAADGSDLAARCRTGADADRDQDCRVVGVTNSLQRYWASQIDGYTPAPTRLFSGSTNTGCGPATSAVGPFYCPADETVYIDLGFFQELRTTYGANGGAFAEAYVLAHEYGHHVQHLLGDDDKARGLRQQTGEQGGSTRLELQADCYAGVWAAAAGTSGFLTITAADITDGLSAAAAVGDDRIQQASAGRVDKESWTHGSAAQRSRWFTTGQTQAQASACDTFAGSV